MWPFGKTEHQKNCEFKRKQREERIAALPEYQAPLTTEELAILEKPASTVTDLLRKGELTPRQVLKAYGKQALRAQKQWNPLTEIAIRDAEKWADHADLSTPLAGFPISLKDPIIIDGYDATGSYGYRINHPQKEGPLVRLLRDAGAVPFVKTNIPKTMMAIGSYNDIWGRTLNPSNPAYSAGGSSSGEGSLIAAGGSRLGIGSDIAGSVRVPAHSCGIYSLRFSAYRWPALGDKSFEWYGFEGIAPVTSPMTRTLGDLKFYIQVVMGMKPWTYDSMLLPLAWRPAELPQKPKVGVIRGAAFLPPTPCMARNIDTVANALQAKGYEVVEFALPRPGIAYDDLANRLFIADNFYAIHESMLPGEEGDPIVTKIAKYARIPRFLRWLYEKALWLLGYKTLSIERSWVGTTSVPDYYNLVAEREYMRREFISAFKDQGVDFIVCPPGPSAALPADFPDSSYMCYYTAIWNLLDCPAGIMPVTRVDKALDDKPYKSGDHHAAKALGATYDANKMHGLPMGVQVVALRHHDEEVLAAMGVVENALHAAGVYFKPLPY